MRFALAALNLIAAAALTASAATISVPNDADSLADAINRALPGDVIELDEGTHLGPIILPDGVILRGADPATTIIEGPDTEGPVVLAEDCASGEISAVTIRHSSSDYLSWEDRMDSPALMLVRSSITVKNCIIEDSAGDGLHIEGAGKPIIEECEARNNFWDGIFVFRGATPVVRENFCHDNGDDGIAVDEGAGGHYEDNICTNNVTNGIAVTGEGTSAVLVGNECSENSSGGIMFRYGASGVVEGNRCESNRQYGIQCYDLGVSPELRENICASNGQDGIYAAWGATPILDNNDIRSNEANGIYLLGRGTGGPVIQNRVEENAGHGIVFAAGAEGTLSGNTVRANGGAGIAILDPGTEPVLGENDVADNAEGDTLRNAAEPTSVLTHWERMAMLIRERQFDEIEALHEWVREVGMRNEEAQSNLGRFYSDLLDAAEETGLDREPGKTILYEWYQAEPESILPLIAEAHLSANEGWALQDDYWTYQQDDSSQEKFRVLMSKAWELLDEAREMDPDSPFPPREQIYIAPELDQSRDEVRALLDASIEHHPDFYPAYEAWAWYEVWWDEGGDVTAFAEEAAEAGGDAMYARIAAYVAAWDEAELQGQGFDFDRLMAGFDDILAAFPDASYFRNMQCYAACLYGEQELAEQLFQEIGDQYDLEVWEDEEYYEDWRAWARDEQPRPDSTSFQVSEGLGVETNVLPLLLGMLLLLFLGLFAALILGVVLVMRRAQ